MSSLAGASFLLVASRFQLPADNILFRRLVAVPMSPRKALASDRLRDHKTPRGIFISSESHACAARLKNAPYLLLEVWMFGFSLALH
jgi:hypothetical protein